MNEELTNQNIFDIFRSGKCVCGEPKWEREPFCEGCFKEISQKTKKRLAQPERKSLFVSAFRRALKEIDGDGKT